MIFIVSFVLILCFFIDYLRNKKANTACVFVLYWLV